MKALTIQRHAPNQVKPMTNLILPGVTIVGYFIGKTTQRHRSTLMKISVPMEAAFNANENTAVV